jgi:ubiquinol-cytochrome c reductase cytochrome b subunit
VARFSTWTFEAFNTVHSMWYVDRVKVVPRELAEYLTPRALAIWIMDDGT